MDYHKNAPWTAISRERLSRMVISDGVTVSSAAARFRVSARTAAKWVGRYRQFGAAGMADHSSRPHHSPRQTSSVFVEKVLALRRLSYNGWRIGRELGLSPSTVSRILRRARLSRWRDLHPLPPVVRYEHPAPGDLLHLDIKGMTRFEEVSVRGDGRRTSTPVSWPCMWPSTITRAWPLPRCWLTKRLKPPSASSTGPWSFSPAMASACARC
jgi:transposase